MTGPDHGVTSPDVPTDRRVHVLESALQTFTRFGYRKTSMEEVARAGHISRPGLYFLFASKEALFRAAVTHALERDLVRVEHTLADPDRPLPERLLEAFDTWAGGYPGPLTRDVSTLMEDHPDLLGDVVETAPRRFAELVTRAVADGAGPASSDVAQTMISTSIGIKHQVGSREDYRARMAVAVDLLLR